MSSPENDSIHIPDEVLVPCPQEKFSAVRVGLRCVGCAHFDGLSDRFPGGPQAFEVRYAVRCRSEAVQRTLVRLVDGGAA